MQQIKWGDDPTFFGPRHFYRETLILRRVSKIESKAKILDVGAGNGSLLKRLVRMGYEAFGIDNSIGFVNYINRAQKRDRKGRFWVEKRAGFRAQLV